MSEAERKKIVLSGIQPSGNQFTLGNYIGAIRNWAVMQEDYDCIYMVANEHSITVRQEPAKLRENTYRALASLLAAGIDPEKSIFFIQSQVPEHAQLAWVWRTVMACRSASVHMSPVLVS